MLFSTSGLAKYLLPGASGTKNAVDKHHIFPKNYLTQIGYTTDRDRNQAAKDLNIATGTMTKLRRNEEVALSVLLRICEYLNCNIGDICDAVRIDSETSL